MSEAAETSSNTLVINGGQGTTSDGIPADGTGEKRPNRPCAPPNSSSTDMNQGVLQIDPWLAPFKDALKRRFSKAREWIKTIDDTEGGLDKFSKACSFRFHSCLADLLIVFS